METRLSILNCKLEKKLSSLEANRKNIEIDWQHKLEEVLEKLTAKIENVLNDLNLSVENLCNLHCRQKKTSNTDEPIFFYQVHPNDILGEEDQFTATLTNFTKKQFFQGIAEIAGTKDKYQYEMLDLTKPERQLDMDEISATKKRDREEIRRLQNQFMLSEGKCINSKMSLISSIKVLETAKKQLELLNNDEIDFDIAQLKKEIDRLQDQVKKMVLNVDASSSKIKPLTQELHQLHSAKVLTGNYDLKIARQNYFFSKQDEVINRLLIQNARNQFLSMLYEIELNKHRQSYRYLASVISFLEQRIQNIEKRMEIMTDPAFTSHDLNRETISSRDTYVNILYEAIVPETSRNDRLLRTYDSMVSEIEIFNKELEILCKEVQKLQSEDRKNNGYIYESLNSLEQIIKKQKKNSSSEFSTLFDELLETIGFAEVQVNDVTKDILAKRKVIASDSNRQTERTLFPIFFNDPARLTRLFDELKARAPINS